MSKTEALIMLKARLRCLSDSNSCNCDHNCDDCDLCYLQGNIGQQKEALRIAISCLEKEVSF